MVNSAHPPAAHAHHHGEGHGHAHAHGGVDPALATTARGLWAVKWSFIALIATGLLQLVVVWQSNSVALLADTLHNFADAATAIPLGIAFLLARRPPSRSFTYGFGRVEDFAGVAVVLTVAASAAVAAWEAYRRIMHPQPVYHLGAIAAASLLSFVGNEGVAIFRLRVGREIGSAALIADGYHARSDGWSSLAVLAGALGVRLGQPLTDPIAGLVITGALILVAWSSVRMVFLRMLDGVEPGLVEQLGAIARDVRGVRAVTNVRARWVGHRLRAELNVAVASELSVLAAHDVALQVEHELQLRLPYLAAALIHVDPETDPCRPEHGHGPHPRGNLSAPPH